MNPPLSIPSRRGRRPGSWRPVLLALMLSIPGSLGRWTLRSAAPPAGNVLLLSADPFVEPTVQVLESFQVPDWTSSPSGLPGTVRLNVERFVVPRGLRGALPFTRFAPAPGASYALVNQVASDISVFNYHGANLVPRSDLDTNGLRDDWEATYGVHDRRGDADQDGLANGSEHDLGSDPADPSDPPPLSSYPAGLVSLWRADDDASDSLGLNAGGLVGPVEFGPGRFGRAFRFNGRGDSTVRIPASPSLDAPAFTITAWIQFEAPEAFQPFGGMVFSKSGPILDSVRLFTDSGATGLSGQLGEVRPDQTALTHSGSFRWRGDPESWYHVALTWSGRVLGLYLNGVPVVLQEFSSSFSDHLGTGQPLAIGSSLFHDSTGQFASPFRGSIDEVAWFHRSLEPNEIAALARSVLPTSADEFASVYSGRDQMIRLISADGKVERFVTVGTDPVLSPDRRRLLFRRDLGTDAARLGVFTLDFATGTQVRVYGLPSSVVGYDWYAGSERVILDDFSLGPSLQGFRTVAHDGSDSRTAMVREIYDAAPTVAPGGGRLAFHNASGNTAGLGGLYVASLDGGLVSNPTRIPNTTFGDAWPRWSPDAGWISFNDGRRLLKIRPDGSDRTVLLEPATPGDAITSWAPWTPDGAWIVAPARHRGEDALFLVSATPGIPRRLFRRLPPDIDALGSGSPGRILAVFEMLPGEEDGDATVEAVRSPHRRGDPLEFIFRWRDRPGAVLESVDGIGRSWFIDPTPTEREGDLRVFRTLVDESMVARFWRLRLP